VEFEWDATKAAVYEKKHGISFEIAAEVFADIERVERFDLASSGTEERWATTGLVGGAEVFVVYAIHNEAVRLISARKANRHEREEYWNRKV
jgi:uncharacterized protein